MRIDIKVKNIILFTFILLVALLAIGSIFSATIQANASSGYEIFVETPEQVATYDESANHKFVIKKITYDGSEYTEPYTIEYSRDNNTYSKITDVGEYFVKIIINDTISFEKIGDVNLKFTIEKKKLNIEVFGSNEIKYTGMPAARNISVNKKNDFSNILSYSYVGENIGELSPLVAPKYVDKYSISFNLVNNNYYIGEDSILYENSKEGLIIVPETLNVVVENLTVKHGERIEPVFKVAGFVNDENKDVIKEMPTVNANYSQVGVYELIASGGKADNYIFIYKSGTLTINKTSFPEANLGGLSELSISGSFSPDCEMSFELASSNEEAVKSKFDAYKARNMSKFNDKINLVFNIKNTQGNFEIDTPFKINLSNISVPNIYRNEIKIIVVDKFNKASLIKSYNYSKGSLSFSMPATEGTVFIVTEQLTVSLLIFAAVFIFVIFILFIVAIRINYKNKKAETEKVNEEEYVWTNRKSKNKLRRRK